jgi:hypothetical protein
MVAGLSPHYWLPGGLTLISLLVWQLDLFSKRSSQKNKILNYSSAVQRSQKPVNSRPFVVAFSAFFCAYSGAVPFLLQKEPALFAAAELVLR